MVVGARDSSTAYVYLGGPAGFVAGRTVLRHPVTGGIGLGNQVAGVGDVDGDGLGDVVVASSESEGGVYFHRRARARS